MLRYLKHNEIDKQKWDECIQSSYNARIYALSWYLNLTCKNWEALVLDDYKAVFPLTTRKKYGFHYLFQPHFNQQLGVFSPKKFTKTEIENFLKAMPSKFRFAEICINSENSSEILPHNRLEPKNRPGNFAGFTLRKNSNFELELGKAYGDIYKNYAENTKRNIRKAMKGNIVVSVMNNTAEIIVKLFKKNKGKELSGLKKDYYDCLGSIVKTGGEKNLIKLMGAFDVEKKLCAAVIFILYKGRAIFLFSATSAEARNNGAMFLLVDRFIFENAESLSILDFEGSNDANLARFYNSFGAKEYVYLQLKKNSLPKYIQWLKQ